MIQHPPSYTRTHHLWPHRRPFRSFSVGQWRPTDPLTLERNDGYWGGAPAMKRVVIRHIAEPATQQLLLEKGDIDIARNLGPDQLASRGTNPTFTITRTSKGRVTNPARNQKTKTSSSPTVPTEMGEQHTEIPS